MDNPGKIYSFPESFSKTPTHYCPGCGHGIIHKLLAQCIDELGIQGRAIVVAPVGCSVLIYNYIKVDGLEAAHGRAPAVATGLKRVRKQGIVISYQGDGDLLAIGTAETVHAANRGEHITVIFVNNAIYGMTGGQMAPTTMKDQVTKTSPAGRNTAETGFPLRACEILDTLENPCYIERCSIHDVKNILKTKKAVKKALTCQIEGRGYAFVEILSTCPTNWGITPEKSMEWVRDIMIPWYPLKCFRDKGENRDAQ